MVGIVIDPSGEFSCSSIETVRIHESDPKIIFRESAVEGPGLWGTEGRL
jgi:hypothetical protein